MKVYKTNEKVKMKGDASQARFERSEIRMIEQEIIKQPVEKQIEHLAETITYFTTLGFVSSKTLAKALIETGYQLVPPGSIVVKKPENTEMTEEAERYESY